MTEFTGARGIVLDLETLQVEGTGANDGDSSVTVCEMFVLSFVGYEVGSCHFYLGDKSQEWMLGRSNW